MTIDSNCADISPPDWVAAIPSASSKPAEYGGWLATFGEGHETYPEQIYAGLGSVWETDRIAVKAYSAMGLLHAAIDAALQLRDEVAVDQIELIDVDVPGAAYEHGGWRPQRPLERTEVHHQPAYDRLPVEDRLTTQLRITLTDGSTHAATGAHPRGTGDRALTNDQIREKYRELTSGTISPDRQAAIETEVLNVEALDDISQLVGLLTPVVRSPLD